MILEILKEKKAIQIKHYSPKANIMKKQQPTPLEGYEIKTIRRLSIIVIIVVLIIASLASCSAEEKLTDYFPLDGRVTWQGDGYIMVKIGEDTIPMFPENPTSYLVGDLIPARKECRTIHSIKY